MLVALVYANRKSEPIQSLRHFQFDKYVLGHFVVAFL